MKCFNHSSVDAVAICRSCGRALCHECVAQVGLTCCCKERCEGVVGTINDQLERGRTVFQKQSSAQMRSGIGILLIGVLFLIFGVSSNMGSYLFYFLGSSGVLFTLMGISQIFAAARLRQK